MRIIELGRPEQEPSLRRITNETFNLTGNTIELWLSRRQRLHIIEPDPTQDPDWNVDCVVIDPDKISIDDEIGYKGLRDGEAIVLGRLANQGRFDFSSYVSREHVQISRTGKEVEVRDLDSTNGTYINESFSARPTPKLVPEIKTAPAKFVLSGESTASDFHPERNEDAFFTNASALALGVFDGVGGNYGSEKASQIAAEVVNEFLAKAPKDAPLSLGTLAVREALLTAHSSIVSAAGGADIATTATVAKVFQTKNNSQYVVVGSVGDSRAYLLREGALDHITLDQAYVQTQDPAEARRLQSTLSQVTSRSEMSDSEWQAFRRRNIINDYLGGSLEHRPTVAISHFEIGAGDTILLTSDGIHDNLTSSEIQDTLASHPAHKAARLLVLAAQNRSRSDHLRAKPDDMTAAVLAYTD